MGVTQTVIATFRLYPLSVTMKLKVASPEKFVAGVKRALVPLIKDTVPFVALVRLKAALAANPPVNWLRLTVTGELLCVTACGAAR